jgi:D-galactarolactone cycloisomerase
MKITDITVHVLTSPLDTPFAFSQGWVTERSATLVEVTTDSGLTGWGEAFAQGLEAPGIAAAVIDKALRPLIVGANPADTEVLWHKMYSMTRDYGRKGSVVAAISAIDTALWDIAGQAAGVPIYQLLGGAFRNQVQPYATGFYRITGQGEADRLVDEAHRHWDNGFTLMKIKLGFGVHDDIDVMTKIAKALQGKDARLMVDTNHAYGRADAMRLGRALNQYDLAWYEEPVVPEDIDSYVYLRENLEMPIAGGENEHTLFGFRQLLNAGAIDIAQPDIGSCGGITAARHIMTLAHASGVQTNPHVWGSAIAQAASLQVIAAIPVTHHSIFPSQPVLEYDQSDHPFRQELVAEPIQMSNGEVAIPDKPGLGIEVNRGVLTRYAA